MKTDVFSIDLHAMSCTNQCRHCWTEGSPGHRSMSIDRIYFVLDKLAEVRQYIPQGAFFLYDEPTLHPQFVKIFERASALGLLWDQFFLPTNGCVLAQAPDATWKRLKTAGVDCLQLTVYGLHETHDVFAGRQGAFQDIVTTIQQAITHGVDWYAGVVLHAENAHQLGETIDFIKRLDPGGQARVGWVPFSWQGRGRGAARVRADAYAQLPASLTGRRSSLVQEKEAVDRILADPQLAARGPLDQVCYGLGFQVDRDLRVYSGGACDGAGVLAASPECAEAFYVGTLGDKGFMPLLEAYAHTPPVAIRLLGEITWGELAQTYGDSANDEMYWLDDLPQHKWAAAYLRQVYSLSLAGRGTG